MGQGRATSIEKHPTQWGKLLVSFVYMYMHSNRLNDGYEL